MVKKLLPLFLLCASALLAQSTTVSGTVSDLGSQTWNNGTYQFTFVPNPAYPAGPYTWTGGTLPTNFTGVLNGTGAYSVSIPSTSAISPIGSSWVATFCPLATWACYSTANTTIQGPTQTFNVTPPAIAINLVNPPASIMRAYSDAEIAAAVIASQYYNLSTTGYRYCSAVSGQTCTAWNNITGSGGTPSFSVITSGTNPNALLVSGTLGPTGPGVLLASALNVTPTQCTGLNFSTGVAANGNANCATPSVSGVVWNAVMNPTAAQTLTMGYTTTFNYTNPLASAFAWANTTAATSGASQSSPQLALTGQYWTGAASAADTWSIGVTEANGANGASTLNFAHTGSTGAAVAQFPGAVVTGTAVAAGGALAIPEGTTPTVVGVTTIPAAGIDVIYADSTAHTLLCSFNNGSFVPCTAGSVAAGTAALGTSAVSSGTCASAVTVSATGVLTTDIVTVSFNSDPTGVVGYQPLTTGMLTIIPYPTANNVNFRVCNQTSASITPGAITLNWKVVR